MIRNTRRVVLIAALLTIAGISGWAAYTAFAHRPPATTRWDDASAAARRADETKAQLPALRLRQQAITLFRTLADSGPRTVRSRAEMLAGLLLLGTAGADSAQRQNVLADSANSLRRAVRLDRANDDAAFDLELLLSRAKASGKPIAQVPRRTKKHTGRPSSGNAGHGY